MQAQRAPTPGGSPTSESSAGKCVLPQGGPSANRESTEQSYRTGRAGRLDSSSGCFGRPNPQEVCQNLGLVPIRNSCLLRLPDLHCSPGGYKQRDQDTPATGIRISGSGVLHAQDLRHSSDHVRTCRMSRSKTFKEPWATFVDASEYPRKAVPLSPCPQMSGVEDARPGP